MELPLDLHAAGVTPREAEVLDALGSRLTNAEIADRLHISIRTVESHVSALLRKLAEPDRRALAARAAALARTTPAPLPRSLADASAGLAFIGRAEQLALLSRIADTTRDRGARRLALVRGEAGVGKSRLVAEAAAQLRERDADVLHGRCAEDVLIPYQAIIEAIRPLRPAPDPFADRAGTGMDATTDRYRLFEDVDRVLTARPRLVVLALDDVQWLDPSGTRLLRHLFHHTDRSPLLVLATCRPETTDPRHPLAVLLADADRDGALEVVELGGLRPDEADRFAALVGAVDEERVRAAWHRTGGNPFLLGELLRHASGDDPLPPVARDAIVRRVARLGPSVFEVVSAAAVAGESFRPADVVAATRLDAADGADSMERAFGAGLIGEDRSRSGYRFAHAIVREALLAVASPVQRARIHLRLADGLEARRPGELAEIARHRHAALPDGDVTRARDSALAACEDASRRLAFEVAATFAGMALDALDTAGGDAADRAPILLRRGRAHLRGGDVGHAIDDFRAALDIAGPHTGLEVVADAALGWADAAPVWGRDAALRAKIEHLLGNGVDDPAIRARLKAKLAQLGYYDTDASGRRQMIDDAVDDARTSGRPDVVAVVLGSAHAALWDPDDIEQRTAIAEEIVAVAAASANPELGLHGLGALAIDRLEAGDMAAAEESFRRHGELAERLHHRLGQRDTEMWRAMRAMLESRFDVAGEHVERARDLGEAAGDPAADTIYWVQRYWLAVERGDPIEMDALVEPCERIIDANSDVPAWRAALAMLHARRHDRDSARAAFEPLTKDGFTSIPRDVVWLNAMTYLAETCAFLDDRDRAHTLLGALEPYASRTVLIDRGLACKGSIARFLGLLAATTGDLDGSANHLARALASHERIDSPALVERTERDLLAVARH